MEELLSTLSRAISLTEKVNKICRNHGDPELKRIMVDLSLELASVKLNLTRVVDENDRLKKKIAGFENKGLQHCPKCGEPGYSLHESKKDPVFGALGGVRRVYKCSFCGFKEEILQTS